MTRTMQVVWLSGLLIMGLACASSEPKSDFELDVDDDEIRVAVSKEAARGIIDGLIGSEMKCGSEIDGEMRALLEELDREGPRARASIRDGDTLIDGRRRGSKLDLDIREPGSGRIQATMPWKLADCMLGRDVVIDEKMATNIKVTVSNDNGRNFSFKLR